jgi:hypothetical protein
MLYVQQLFEQCGATAACELAGKAAMREQRARWSRTPLDEESGGGTIVGGARPAGSGRERQAELRLDRALDLPQIVR